VVDIGYVADPSAIINRSLIHVCIESYDNTTNQSLLEGMAAGCAVVASSVGATETVVTEDVGVLVNLDARDAADAIVSLLSNLEHARRLGQAARRKVLAEHNVHSYIKYLEAVHDFSSARDSRERPLVREASPSPIRTPLIDAGATQSRQTTSASRTP
jgi:glycosyltransferase involved in cell wall biosynthesis